MDKYKEYAELVVSGGVTSGKWLQLAARRYLSWFDRSDIFFDPSAADKVVNFIQRLSHFTGRHAGKPFLLEPWQKWLVYAIFGFLKKSTGQRVVKNVFLSIARKNGKSALAAAIALYCLVADNEPNAEIELVANSKQQAKITFGMCGNLVSSIDKKGKFFRQYRDTIHFDYTKSLLQVLASDVTSLDGYNASCFICDEVHEYKDSKLYDVLKSSQGMRDKPLSVLITTSGFNLHGFCKNYEDSVKEVVSGQKDDDTLLGVIFQLDEGDDWKDPTNWQKANPNLGVTVLPEYLQEQVQQAVNTPSLEVGIRTKNLNQWLSSSDIWLSNDLLLKHSRDLDFTDTFQGQTTYIGVDLSSVSDLTAVSYLTVKEGIYYFKTLYYLPESSLSGNVNSELYRGWKRSGYLKFTPGNCVDYDYILSDILKLGKLGYVEKIAYDSWNSTQFAINATEEGLPLEPYAQTLGSFNRPTKEFERLVRTGKVVIDNNPVTRWCFGNVSLKEDYHENVKPVKTSRDQKIDGVIAMVEALGIYLLSPNYGNQIFTL